MMALKVSTYGVVVDAFCNYYQMDKSMARTCCEYFNEAPLLQNILCPDFLVQESNLLALLDN